MPTVLEPPSTQEEIDSSAESQAALDLPWLVVVYDDPVNTMSFVTMVFEKVLALPKREAERKMWEVHSKGRSVVWHGGREPAEMILQQLHLYGLQAKLERSKSK